MPLSLLVPPGLKFGRKVGVLGNNASRHMNAIFYLPGGARFFLGYIWFFLVHFQIAMAR
jgi:hypothetical protein